MICKPKFYFVNDFSSEDMDLCPSFLVLINRKQTEEFTIAHLTITDVIYEMFHGNFAALISYLCYMFLYASENNSPEINCFACGTCPLCNQSGLYMDM